MLRRSNRLCKSKMTEKSTVLEPPNKRKRGHYSEVDEDDSFEDDSSGDEFVPTQTTESNKLCTLNLSESDSDNDAQGCDKAKSKPLEESDCESEDDVCQTNFDFTTLLNPQGTTNVLEDNVESKNINIVEENNLYNNMDVAKILSVGEGVNLGSILKNTDDIAEEELKRDDNYIIPDMVEINVKLPNDMKCKKGQDVQNVLRRRINTICKDTQILIHKVNLLLWISYGNHLNSVLNSPEVMGSALSLVPSEKAYPPKQCDLNYLENYIKWFSKKIKVSSKNDPLSEINTLSLVERFSKREAKTRYELVAMFISMLRSLGLNVRLVINLNAVSIKPNSDQLLGPLAEEDRMKSSSSKSKVESKQKTPAKSEYFNKKSKNFKTGGNKKSKVNAKTEENISSTDEDEIFVKNNKRAKSEYFNKKSSKSQTSSKKCDTKKSKSVADKKKLQSKKPVKTSDKIDRRVLSTDDEDSILIENSETLIKKKVKNDFWAEVFLEMEEKWFCVDVLGQRLHCIKEIYVSCILQYIIY